MDEQISSLLCASFARSVRMSRASSLSPVVCGGLYARDHQGFRSSLGYDSVSGRDCSLRRPFPAEELRYYSTLAPDNSREVREYYPGVLS